MQKPSADKAMSRAAENMHNHAQRLRVKAWRMIQQSNPVQARQLLKLADTCDRALIPLLASIDSVWNRQ